MTLTFDRLREIIHYDPEAGVFRWRQATANCITVGDIAGGLNRRGYWRVKIDGRNYQGHRLAMFYVTGEWPQHHVDHRDGDPANNRLANLREATNSQNQANSRRPKNNTSGLKGVSWHRGAKRWIAHISVNYKLRHLGYFDSAEEAHNAYCRAAREFHGEFAKAG